VSLFGNIYYGKRVLVTGHTGFKGSWLSLWLTELGAEIAGIALAPDARHSHWSSLNLAVDDYHCDIRNADKIKKLIKSIKPEIVFHLAAQPLVRRSYQAPVETWSTNVMGTVNVLEACRDTPSVQAIVIITTDKCYANHETSIGYREGDRLGGHDPYSASKAGSELVADSYRKSFFGKGANALLASARAGNVIGGGDWSEDRLVPDLIRAMIEKKSLEIRNPAAIRPWQHVLEPISGYLVLGQRLLMGHRDAADPWNFGPSNEANQSVTEVLKNFKRSFNCLNWHETKNCQPHETKLLHLDSSKAHKKLNWYPIWTINTSIRKTAEWYEQWLINQVIISEKQLSSYISDAIEANADWVNP